MVNAQQEPRIVELRDQAQSHLEMSLNAGWISPGLAQAALVRCPHQMHRSKAKLHILYSSL